MTFMHVSVYESVSLVCHATYCIFSCHMTRCQVRARACFEPWIHISCGTVRFAMDLSKVAQNIIKCVATGEVGTVIF